MAIAVIMDALNQPVIKAGWNYFAKIGSKEENTDICQNIPNHMLLGVALTFIGAMMVLFFALDVSYFHMDAHQMFGHKANEYTLFFGLGFLAIGIRLLRKKKV